MKRSPHFSAKFFKEALHNLSRIAFESSQTVLQGDQAQRLPDWQVKLGNAAAASVRPNRLAAGAFARLIGVRIRLRAASTPRSHFLVNRAQSTRRDRDRLCRASLVMRGVGRLGVIDQRIELGQQVGVVLLPGVKAVLEIAEKLRDQPT